MRCYRVRVLWHRFGSISPKAWLTVGVFCTVFQISLVISLVCGYCLDIFCTHWNPCWNSVANVAVWKSGSSVSVWSHRVGLLIINIFLIEMGRLFWEVAPILSYMCVYIYIKKEKHWVRWNSPIIHHSEDRRIISSGLTFPYGEFRNILGYNHSVNLSMEQMNKAYRLPYLCFLSWQWKTN